MIDLNLSRSHSLFYLNPAPNWFTESLTWHKLRLWACSRLLPEGGWSHRNVWFTRVSKDGKRHALPAKALSALGRRLSPLWAQRNWTLWTGRNERSDLAFAHRAFRAAPYGWRCRRTTATYQEESLALRSQLLHNLVLLLLCWLPLSKLLSSARFANGIANLTTTVVQLVSGALAGGPWRSGQIWLGRGRQRQTGGQTSDQSTSCKFRGRHRPVEPRCSSWSVR